MAYEYPYFDDPFIIFMVIHVLKAFPDANFRCHAYLFYDSKVSCFYWPDVEHIRIIRCIVIWVTWR